MAGEEKSSVCRPGAGGGGGEHKRLSERVG